ncbi:MAG: helix-turn-helix domain-containing protein [Lachnospirales bacterium]
MNIGQKIKQRRLALNMSADELAEKLNKHRATVYRYESGDIEQLPISILEPLADALQVDASYFLSNSTEEIKLNNNLKNNIKSDENEPEEFTILKRVMNNSSKEDREKMMDILKAAFKEAFSEDDE